ncbi:MAG: patatin-like phospholipase family protein [Anaerolineae bacterium]
MIAFVLSGGGNRGALEVGALLALFEHGIQPDILVGTSAGAMNATFIATDPSLAGAQRLAELWLGVSGDQVYPGNILTMAWRFITGQDSFYPNDSLRRLAEMYMPPGFERFGDITAVKLYVTAANLNTSTLYLFGDDPTAPLIEAALASAAIPTIFPPIEYGGWQYVDGGVVATVPISIAVDKGATVIYAINVGYSGQVRKPIKGIVNIGQQTITTMIYQQLLDDLEEIAARPEIMLHHIQITAFQDIPGTDFSHTAEMIEEGKRVTEEYLAHPRQPGEPLRIARVIEPAPPPPGAVIWRRRRPEEA